MPRFRLPAPLRGSTPRQFFILSLNYRYLCRSAQNDTEADCYTGDIILIRQSNFATNGLYPAIRSPHCVISEQTPAAFRRTPKGRRQAESRHSRKAFQQIASSRKTSATAALCNNFPPPKPTKTSPKSTRPEQSESNLRSARAGAFGGSSRRVGEVWRGRDASFKRRPSPSKVFFPSFLLSFFPSFLLSFFPSFLPSFPQPTPNVTSLPSGKRARRDGSRSESVASHRNPDRLPEFRPA